MTVDPRIKAARRLRAAGATVREIADTFGVAQSTVCRWTTPGSAENGRAGSLAWKNANRDLTRAYDKSPRRRGHCAACGMPRGRNSLTKAPGMCRDCYQVNAQVRRDVMAGMYRDGWTFREMAAVLEMEMTSLSVEIHRLRRRGYDLPFRIPADRHAKLVAAARRRWQRAEVAA